jgi:hypothetical protein
MLLIVMEETNFKNSKIMKKRRQNQLNNTKIICYSAYKTGFYLLRVLLREKLLVL